MKQAAVESRSAQKQPAADDVIRIDIELVVCDVLILDRQGHAVQGLTQEDFTVAEDGQPQHISHFSLGDEGEVERSKYLLQIIDGWTRCQSAVSKVATITGGFAAFLENPNQAGEIYSRILSDMNSRYVIGYYPTNKTRDGKRRKVLVEVRNHPEYTVEGRKTYYAPGPEQ